MRLISKRWAIFGLAVLCAVVFTGAVIASLGGGPTEPGALAEATMEAPMIPLATIEAGSGKPARGVYAQVTSTGDLCLWDAPSVRSLQKQGGCNSLGNALGGGVLSASLAYDGGPAAADVTDARLIGLVAEDVADVQVVLADGTRRAMRLYLVELADERYRAFGYRFKPKDIRSGGPVAVVALDAAGKEVGQQATGFHG
jgi:hypothetical protein